MNPILISPANASILGIPGQILFLLIPLVGVAAFSYIMVKRVTPLLRAQPDPRLNEVPSRFYKLVKFGLLQWRQPRYMFAGVLHILLFAGFMALALRSTALVFVGVAEGFDGDFGGVYGVLKDLAASVVLIVAVIAAVRRGLFTPKRYEVPSRYGKKDHTGEAILVLLLIVGLVCCDMLFEGSHAVAQLQGGAETPFMLPGTGSWLASLLLAGASPGALKAIHLSSYLLHELIFFSFLCLLPFGKHFHVITSLPNVFLGKLHKGVIKPAAYGISDEELDNLDSLGVKKFEDFTWKQMLDFYSCVDCGRCSDNCPANAVGRPLSPRFISIKCRDYAFKRYPVLGKNGSKDEHLIGTALEEDEIWSCTTCGACEEECPVTIEYIDKIVDVRRGMVDEGLVPQSLQKPLSALEKRGNPWGKLEKKRSDWTKQEEFSAQYPVKVLDGKETADTLYFVDSITSYDDRMQDLGRATARVLTDAGIDFGILGASERDSGHEVLRFGEETLFQTLKEHNTEAIQETGVARIVTADPHAFNALKNDYRGLPPVEHISQTILKSVQDGKFSFNPVEDATKIYTYHDPCYLGRHNETYDDPRQVLDAIPGLRRVEMERCRDRSFCCGGGGLMLFFEPEEEQRMGVLRVEMAQKAGANVIVTACPFCLVNIEDAIKVSGLEGQMEAIDLVELVDRNISRD